MEITAKFVRPSGQVFVYCGYEMLDSYWHVAGLAKDEDGKYRVESEDGRTMGRIMGDAIIKESW